VSARRASRASGGTTRRPIASEDAPREATAGEGDDEREVDTELVVDEEPDPAELKAEPAKVVEPELDEKEEKNERGALVTYDPLQRYLQEIRRIALLTREEEHELAVRYQTEHDVEAAYKLVTGNLRLVVMIAREYQRSFRNLLDLVQEGNIGLMEAVKNFDPYRGVLPSYAVWWIRAYIIRYVINNWRMVSSAPQAQRKLFFNLRRRTDSSAGFVAGPASRRPSRRQGEKIIEMRQRLAASDLSVDTPLRDGGDATVLDVLRKRRDRRGGRGRRGSTMVGQHIRSSPKDRTGHLRPPPARRGSDDFTGDRRQVRHQPRARPADREPGGAEAESPSRGAVSRSPRGRSDVRLAGSKRASRRRACRRTNG
jgi:RNA polymerase sigma-32 factor